jgi:hypothetical protein
VVALHSVKLTSEDHGNEELTSTQKNTCFVKGQHMKTSVVNKMFKQKYWIRFELGLVGLEEKAYVNEVLQRSKSICNVLFSKKDEVHVINRISYLKEDRKHEKLGMHRFFKTKRAVKYLAMGNM